MTEAQRGKILLDLVIFMSRFARVPDNSVSREQVQPYRQYLNNLRQWVAQAGGDAAIMARINGAEALLNRKAYCAGARILGVCSDMPLPR